MYDDYPTNPVQVAPRFTTEHAAAAIVLGALLFLILVSKGFRGVNVGGASVGVR